VTSVLCARCDRVARGDLPRSTKPLTRSAERYIVITITMRHHRKDAAAAAAAVRMMNDFFPGGKERPRVDTIFIKARTINEQDLITGRRR